MLVRAGMSTGLGDGAQFGESSVRVELGAITLGLISGADKVGCLATLR